MKCIEGNNLTILLLTKTQKQKLLCILDCFEDDIDQNQPTGYDKEYKFCQQLILLLTKKYKERK